MREFALLSKQPEHVDSGMVVLIVNWFVAEFRRGSHCGQADKDCQ
jgi:hypothetical protein